jgi:serine phosphatase RsbU (regulator of sigma subunit)
MRDLNEIEYGSVRLRRTMQETSDLSAQGIIDHVTKDMDDYRASEALDDDYTILVLKRK